MQDQPPAIPKKSRVVASVATPGHGAAPGPARPAHPSRKLSQYDNVADAESLNLRQVCERRGKGEVPPLTHLQLLHQPEPFSPHATSSPGRPHHPRGLARSALGAAELGDIPPPLPPKKRNIMSYMEMFGQSVLPAPGDTDLFQGFVHSHDLLQHVWQHNFHEYTEYTPSGLLHFPFLATAAPPPEPAPAPQSPLHAYMNLAPALPPKLCPAPGSRSRPGSFRQQVTVA